MKNKKRGQVWVETVLYTLIGLALIGMILAFALPKITKTQEKLVTEQTISSLKLLDQTISNVVQSGPDNVRMYEISFKEGNLIIDGQNDLIYFQIDNLKNYYSEPETKVMDGRVGILSYGKKDFSSVKLDLNYTGYANITFGGKDAEQRITQSPTAYKLFISNMGNAGNGLFNVDIRME